MRDRDSRTEHKSNRRRDGSEAGRPRKPAWRRRPASREPDAPAVRYGWHTVRAELENPERRITGLLATGNAMRRLRDGAVPLSREPEIVKPDTIAARLGPDAVHQGLL